MTNTQIQIKKALLRLPNGQYIAPYTDCKGALEIGDIGTSLYIDETQGLRRRLNGSVVEINANTTPFLNKLKSIRQQYPQLFCSEERWHTIADSNYLGQCGKFVIDEDGTYTTHTYNCTLVGNLVNTDGIITGFTNSTSYVAIPNTMPYNTSTTLDIIMKINVTNLNVCNALLGNVNDSPTSGGCVFRTTGTARLYLWGTTNSSSWTTNQVDTGIDLTLGEQYIKLSYNGTQYVASRSVDGTTWTDGTPITTAKFTNSNAWMFATGSPSAFYLRGSADIKECYINVDNVQWWTGANTITVSGVPYIRLPKVLAYTGCMSYVDLPNIGLSNRLLVYSQKPTADNNFQWCNVYSDGWCEQGGSWNNINGQGTGYQTYTVYFTRPYRDTAYTALTVPNYTANDLWPPTAYDRQKDRITFYRVHETGNYSGASWYSCGWTKIPSKSEYILESSDAQYPYFIQINQGQATLSTIRNDWQINNPYTLFDSKQSLYPLNNASWLVSKGQWNSKDYYTSAYEALCVELDNTITTNTTVTLPSGGRYTKHLQTLNFRSADVEREGFPTIENGLLVSSDDSNYVKMNVTDTSFATASEWELVFRFQVSSTKSTLCTSYESTPTFGDPYFLIETVNADNGIRFSNSVFEYELKENQGLTEGLEVNEWYTLKFAFDDADGYNIKIYDANNTLIGNYDNPAIAKITLTTPYVYFKNCAPIDLRTVQYKYTINSIEYTKTCGVEYREVVWDKSQHISSEADYKYNFIVNKTNNTFRLPIYDRLLTDTDAELYYYIGDTAQNTSLVDVGRITSEIVNLNTRIDNFDIPDIPVIETSTYDCRNVTLYNGIVLGDHAIDLSSYIPLDGHEYDVHGRIYFTVGDTSGTNRVVQIYNNGKSQLLWRYDVDGVTSPNSGHSTGHWSIPLSASNRTIILNLSGGSSNLQFTTFYCVMLWYRKY